MQNRTSGIAVGTNYVQHMEKIGVTLTNILIT